MISISLQRISLVAIICSIWLATVSRAVDANDLTGPWIRHTIDDRSRGADGVRLADMNNDGLLDVAVGWEEGGITCVYQHPGIASVHARWPAATVGKTPNVEDAVWADLDGDGRLDVVSSCEGNTRRLFVHWSPNRSAWQDENAWHSGSFDFGSPSPAAGNGISPDDRWTSSQQWMFALPMEVDGRNGIDLVVGSKGKGAGVGWLESPTRPRDLAAWRYHRLIKAGWIMSLRAIDMDGDSDLDVLFSDRRGTNSGVYWLENPRRKTSRRSAPDNWHVHEIGARGLEVLFLDVTQLPHKDADGRSREKAAVPNMEIVVAVRPVGLLRFRRQGTLDDWRAEQIAWPDGCGEPKAAAIGDIDLDGKGDVVFTCEGAKDVSGVRWLSQQEAGWRDHEISGLAGTKFDRIELIDLDEDGDLDVMTCEERENLGVIWYENPTRSR